MCTDQCHRTNLCKEIILLSHLTNLCKQIVLLSYLTVCCLFVSVLFGTSFVFYALQYFSLR